MRQVVIIDDEPIAIRILEEYFAEVEDFEVLASFRNPVAALQSPLLSQADALFIDIKMPKMSGMEFLQALGTSPLVVFTTAYDEHALDSFNFNTVDYLMKPIPFPRFWQCLEKIRQRSGTTATHAAPNYLVLKSGKQLHRIAVSDIEYIQSDGDYIHVFTQAGRLLHYSTLKAMETRLATEGFVRIHQSYLVPLLSIVRLDGNRVFTASREFPVSRSYKPALLKLLEA